MRTISAMDLRRRMGEFLDRASAGEHVVIERDRRPLAVLVPYEDAMRLRESPADARARAVAALDRLEGFARRRKGEHREAWAVPDAATAVRDERSTGHRAAR
ncbi:MAG: type II toxin-antitoxin system Phd/YefM family antitoxin [Candidatus Limnocylindria bacterium]